MAIPDNIIDQIQDKVDIVDVISQYVPLKRSGRNYKAACPFHKEKTPSFMVSPDKQIYHCFGCGAGGNVFSFLMRYENCEFPEAVEMLAEKARVTIPHSARGASGERDGERVNQLYAINELAVQFFQDCFANSPEAKEYIRSRGIGDETVKTFRIGYSPDSWEALIQFFAKKGIKAEPLLGAGLIIPNDRGSYYDRFRKRLIFPITDVRGKVLGFGARVLDTSLPKYVNSPETAVYSKGRNLYGLHISKEDVKRQRYALVVEGYLDFIIPFQAGIRNVVATLGTALTPDQVKLLKRFTNTAILLFDPDDAGMAASLRNLDFFVSEDMNVYVAALPAGYDPDSYIRKFGAEEFKTVIKSGKNIFDYKLDILKSRFDITSPQGKANIAAEMLATISRINNAVIKSSLVQKLAQRLGVDEESLKIELKKVKAGAYEPKSTATPGAAEKDMASAEKIVVALLLDGGIFVEKVRAVLSPDELIDAAAVEAVKAIFDLAKDEKRIDPARIIRHLGNGSASAVFISEAVSISETLVDKERSLADCVAWIKKNNIKLRLEKLQSEIKRAHDSKDDPAVKRLVTEYHNLLKAG